MFISKNQLKLAFGAVCSVVLPLLISSPANAGCMRNLCGVASDAVDGTTIRVEVNFPAGHKSHPHTILVTGVDAFSGVLWWEEIMSTGNVFETIVPKSVRDKIVGVDAMIAGPSDEFDSAGTKRILGPLPVGVMLLPIKRSMFH